jgi:hypothetical protein
MKKFIVTAIVFAITFSALAQDEEEEVKKKGFKKENLFTGGSVTASFYSGGTVLGLSPTFGYSINKFIDAGIVLNFTYTGERAFSGDKYRQFVYGPGAFARIYPVNMIFIQGMFEHNFISQTFKPASGGASQKFNAEANSFLAGAGYCNGREGTGSTFFYISIMVDLIRDINSPYLAVLQNGDLAAQPVFRAGIQIPLFQGGGRRREF